MVVSPLRYPGGKAKLYPFFSDLIRRNSLFRSLYCEPYAGGAGLAIKLLSTGFVERVSINDIDPSIYAFWKAALRMNDDFCRLIERTPITIDEWHRQREIWRTGDAEDHLALGFAAYFLNRTNRSGIIDGAGPIGGYSQNGDWKLDVRLVKSRQIDNLKSLSRYADQIELHNLDALDYLSIVVDKEDSFIYLDPPYYVKGKKLYKNFYIHDDHVQIAEELKKRRSSKWVVSYDDVPQIRDAYSTFSPISYSLNYSAGRKTLGTEVMFLSDALFTPEVKGFLAA
jgi:DNA adenine methylase